MKTRTSRPSFSCSFALASLLLGGIVGCATETGGGSSPQAPSGTLPAACGTLTTLSSIGPNTSDLGGGPLVVQGDAVIWGVFADAGSISKVPLDGGASHLIFPSQQTALAIAADATNVYWSDMLAVYAAAAGGGPITPIVAPVGPPQQIEGIAVDADSVYWLQVTTGSGAANPASVMKAPLAGGAATEVASLQELPEQGGSFTLDDTSVYWSDPVAGTIMSVPKAGGTPVTLATGQGHPTSLVVAADSVYWITVTDQSSALVAKVPKTGGAPVTWVAGPPSAGDPTGDLAVDATGVYYILQRVEATHDEGSPEDVTPTIVHTSLDGGSMEVIALELHSVATGLITCPGGVCWEQFPLPGGPDTNLLRWQACQ